MPLSTLNEVMVYLKMKHKLWEPGCNGFGQREWKEIDKISCRVRLLEKRMGNASMVKAQPTASGNSGRVCRSSSKVLLFKIFFILKGVQEKMKYCLVEVI